MIRWLQPSDWLIERRNPVFAPVFTGGWIRPNNYAASQVSLEHPTTKSLNSNNGERTPAIGKKAFWIC